jgi:tRNA(Ile)-lysidine synthase TilS/MesJ
VTEKIPESVQREGRKMRITRGNLRQIIREELQHSLREAEIIDLAQTAGLPWEFGSSGYAARGRGLERKMAHLGRESSRRDAEILAVALSNRAEELINFERAVDPRFFDDFADDLAQRLGSGWFGGGETHEDLGSIVSKIDAGDYFDEEIDAVPMWREGEWQEEETAPWSVKDLSQMYDPQADPSEWGVKDLSDTHGPEEF